MPGTHNLLPVALIAERLKRVSIATRNKSYTYEHTSKDILRGLKDRTMGRVLALDMDDLNSILVIPYSPQNYQEHYS